MNTLATNRFTCQIAQDSRTTCLAQQYIMPLANTTFTTGQLPFNLYYQPDTALMASYLYISVALLFRTNIKKSSYLGRKNNYV